ncbi:CaiB/BaiF CoA transferase family protein [Rugosimonospora africana]|uniref:CoA transferase n=1 Tax=Rugosimonospora africana TaxID=556532 RepID=A0A8J3QQZ5_9ACTN|nr:CaiB/BaiF CoA-transferase family protein [Rugosimonospora africana]GIH14167.1 CoA transferase [Rugosimonospora africana]
MPGIGPAASPDAQGVTVDRPLDGVTVVSVEQAVAAPFATRQLADLGARVIKVEREGGGDFARDYDDVVGGLSSHFVWLNRSKESIALDLKTERGREALRRLVARADVFVQNLAPGAARRLGFGADELRERHPPLVCCSISGYGDEGPYADRKAYDLLVQCEAGLLSVTGTPDQPVKVGISVADIAAGMYAYSGVLGALLRRTRTGTGATIEVSMLEALVEWMGYPLYYARYAGRQPARAGASHPVIAPYGPVRCADGVTVFLGVQNEREWAAFCREVLRDPAIGDDHRFRTNSLRARHRDALGELIDADVARLDSAELRRRLDRAGIANGQVRDLSEVWAHPQLAARDRWRSVESSAGTLHAFLPPGQPDDIEPDFGPVPEPGEHTEAILRELGID